MRWVGPYRPEEQRAKLKEVDWVIVPSIWWENSPMVIQEAFTAGRPLIVSNIGGMAEKVQEGVDGLHFSARNPQSLAKVMLSATSTEVCQGCVEQITTPLSYTQCAVEHITYFGKA